jgi:hypothetical protein
MDYETGRHRMRLFDLALVLSFFGILNGAEPDATRIKIDVYPENGTSIKVDGERHSKQKYAAVKPGTHVLELERFGTRKKFKIVVDSGETHEFYYRFHSEIGYFAGISYLLSTYNGDFLNGLSISHGIRMRSVLLTMSAFTTLPGDDSDPDKMSESYGIEGLGIKYLVFNHNDRLLVYPGLGLGLFAAYFGEVENIQGGLTSYSRPHAISIVNSDMLVHYHLDGNSFAFASWKYLFRGTFHLFSMGMGLRF